MTETPQHNLKTNPTLLKRIRRLSDQASWQEFVACYWGLIYGVARRSGLSDDEAKDVAQETLVGVAKGIGRYQYDPNRCSFKNWMLQLTRWRIINQYRKHSREEQVFDHAAQESPVSLETMPDPAGFELTKIWEQEWATFIYGAACEAVKEKVSAEQFQIFDLLVNEQWTVERLCRTLGINRSVVYLAKHRISRRVQKEVKRLEEEIA